jgi:DNA sulfur modification protein DndD
MHRGSPNNLPVKSSFIEVEFDYGDQDGVRTYTTRRSWNRKAAGGITEAFQLSVNGSLVSDVDAAHWQDFVEELIPMGVSDLFFFDGEKVQLLAEDESDRLTLAEAVKNLHGTDIIEKLNADVSIYRTRAIQVVAEENSAPDLDVLSTSVDVLRGRLAQAVDAASESASVSKLLDQKFSDLRRRFKKKAARTRRTEANLRRGNAYWPRGLEF